LEAYFASGAFLALKASGGYHAMGIVPSGFRQIY